MPSGLDGISEDLGLDDGGDQSPPVDLRSVDPGQAIANGVSPGTSSPQPGVSPPSPLANAAGVASPIAAHGTEASRIS